MTKLPLHAFSTALLGLLLATSAYGQNTDYWTAGTGTWDTSTLNWNTASDGSGTATTFTAGDDAVFSASTVTGASTVTVSGTQTVNGITFNNNVLFAGGVIDLGAGGLTIDSGVSVTQGTTSIAIDASQTWTNNSATEYTANSYGFTASTASSAATLTVAAGIWSVRGGLADGTGGGALSLTIEGGSSWTFNNTTNNTYTGGTNIKAGSLRVSQTANGIGSGTLTLGDASGTAAAMYNPVNSGTVANNIVVLAGGNSSIGIGGSGNIQTYTGTFTLNNSNPLTLTTTAGSGSTPTIIITGSVTGTGGLAMTRNASNLNNLNVTLSGANTYSGGTTVNYGTLNINNGGTDATNSAIGTGTLTINGGALDNTSGSAVTLATNNAQTWAGNFGFTGTNSLNLGTGAVALGAANRTVTVSNNTLTVGGVISATGAFGIAKAGAGTLDLSGINTYTGVTAVNAGTLLIDGSLAGASAVSVASGARIGGQGSVGAVTFNTGAGLAYNVASVTQGTGLTATSFSGTGIGAFTVYLTGAAAGFNENQNYSWTVLTTSAVSSMSLTSLTLDTTGFLASYTGSFSLSESGDNLIVNYTGSAIPEPATYGALLGGLAALVTVIARRRRKARAA